MHLISVNRLILLGLGLGQGKEEIGLRYTWHIGTSNGEGAIAVHVKVESGGGLKDL